ncbi:MAG: YraN family protein [Gemmatimonadetes bacterium]|nr:YraN family protein [Gemmatimonadota bacterium]MDA1104094.1 YraN family protein [Gemmatimonadota bacterium]
MATAKTHAPHALGVWGEEMATRRLETDGWHVLERNYRHGRHEVDLIAVRRGILAFVEVKTRSGDTFGPPEEAVTHRKRREIEKVARDFLRRHTPRDLCVRFDVVAIVVTRGTHLVRYEHIEDAWRP